MRSPLPVGRADGDGTEEAYYFSNRGGRSLFAVRHEGAATHDSLGVVFCHPLGVEKQNSYRPYVKLARSLASRGVASLRFDSLGFGDSEGDLTEATIESQIEDTVDAVAHFVEATQVSRVVLFGVRLGGTIAALTSGRLEQVAGLGLVAPIEDGAVYADQLIGTHRMAALAMGEKPPTKEALLGELDRTGSVEVAAELIGRDFMRQLGDVDLSEALSGFKGRVLLAAPVGETSEVDALRLRAQVLAPGCADCVAIGFERDFWSQRSMYDQYLPQAFFEQFCDWVSACR